MSITKEVENGKVNGKAVLYCEGKYRIVDEICQCGHLKSKHEGWDCSDGTNTGHLHCNENGCDCQRWTFSNRFVMQR